MAAFMTMAAMAAAFTVVAFAVPVMTVAAVLTMTVVAAVGLAAVSQAAGQKCSYGLIGIPGDTGIDFDAGLLQRIDGTAANAAADQNTDSLFPQEAGKSTVAEAVCSDDAAGTNCTVFDFVYLKSFGMAKVLKHLPVFVSDCNFHSVSSFRQRGHLHPRPLPSHKI